MPWISRMNADFLFKNFREIPCNPSNPCTRIYAGCGGMTAFMMAIVKSAGVTPGD